MARCQATYAAAVSLVGDFVDDPRFAGLTKVKASKLRTLERSHPGVPGDYLEFLRTVGWGTPEAQPSYAFYSGLITPSFVYDRDSARRVGHLLLFGDDYQGYCNGFDPLKGWHVVEVEPGAREWRRVAMTFTAFVRKKWRRRRGKKHAAT